MIKHILKIVWNRKRANALIVAEIFLSFLVLFGVLTIASALIRSGRQPLGFEWRGVSNVSIENFGQPMAASDDQKVAVDMIMRELAAMPEIAAVAASRTPAYSMSSDEGQWTIEGKNVFLTVDQVTDGFADVMQLRIVHGRWFNATDDAVNFIPVVIDTDLARAVYGVTNAVGRKFADHYGKERRVVGVVAPYRKNGEFTNFGKPINMLFVRTSAVVSEDLPTDILVRFKPGTPASFEQSMSERLHAIAPGSTFRIRQMSRMREFSLRASFLPLAAVIIVAGFLLAMVVLGLTGVLWQNVTRRRREIGLRRAIGATAPAVQRQIVFEVAMLTTLAVILGAIVVMQLPVLGLFNLITPAAFATGVIAAVIGIYALTVVCGVYPGWLASRVQPAQALHYE